MVAPFSKFWVGFRLNTGKCFFLEVKRSETLFLTLFLQYFNFETDFLEKKKKKTFLKNWSNVF